jgi:hypothetical protein
LRLTLKTLEGNRIAGQLFREKLKRHAPAQLEVLCLEDHSHAATAYDSKYAIMGNFLTDERGSSGWRLYDGSLRAMDFCCRFQKLNSYS